MAKSTGRALTEGEQKYQRGRIPYKGIDCVMIRVNGENACWSCYHCLERLVADLEDADVMENVITIWKPPTWSIDKTVICSLHEHQRALDAESKRKAHK